MLTSIKHLTMPFLRNSQYSSLKRNIQSIDLPIPVVTLKEQLSSSAQTALDSFKGVCGVFSSFSAYKTQMSLLQERIESLKRSTEDTNNQAIKAAVDEAMTDTTRLFHKQFQASLPMPLAGLKDLHADAKAVALAAFRDKVEQFAANAHHEV